MLSESDTMYEYSPGVASSPPMMRVLPPRRDDDDATATMFERKRAIF